MECNLSKFEALLSVVWHVEFSCDYYRVHELKINMRKLQWRYNGRDGVSNYQPYDCLLAFVRGIPRWPVNSPHKGPVTRKLFPFDGVIMISCRIADSFTVSLRGAEHTVYPKKYAHGFVVLCFVVVMQSFIMNSHEVFIHIHQGCFAGRSLDCHSASEVSLMDMGKSVNV